VTQISEAGGVNLRIFVVECGRLTESTHKHYTLFYRGFCGSKVPIVIVVTNCEDAEPTIDSWWTDHEPSFTLAGMLFDGHACVCAGGINTRFLLHVVKQLIVEHCTLNGWTKV